MALTGWVYGPNMINIYIHLIPRNSCHTKATQKLYIAVPPSHFFAAPWLQLQKRIDQRGSHGLQQFRDGFIECRCAIVFSNCVQERNHSNNHSKRFKLRGNGETPDLNPIFDSAFATFLCWLFNQPPVGFFLSMKGYCFPRKPSPCQERLILPCIQPCYCPYPD